MEKRKKPVKTAWGRKSRHLSYMSATIMDLHNEIFHLALDKKINENKVDLIKKYRKRIKLLRY